MSGRARFNHHGFILLACVDMGLGKKQNLITTAMVEAIADESVVVGVW